MRRNIKTQRRNLERIPRVLRTNAGVPEGVDLRSSHAIFKFQNHLVVLGFSNQNSEAMSVHDHTLNVPMMYACVLCVDFIYASIIEEK